MFVCFAVVAFRLVIAQLQFKQIDFKEIGRDLFFCCDMDFRGIFPLEMERERARAHVRFKHF